MPHPSAPRVAIVGGGPAGLMAAEVLAAARVAVDLFDAMPSPGRKFLLAGVGGLNLTHSEPREPFLARYRERRAALAPLLEAFDADALRAWAQGLGIETFVGSSGRVFPRSMKAAPLLRAWLKRLREAGVVIHTRHRWLGWHADGALHLQTPAGAIAVHADALLLALGGGSWPRLGSDGAWVSLLTARGVAVAPLRPSNCGFDVAAWSEPLRSRFAGAPLKQVALHVDGEAPRRGECVLTASGLEGSLIYALSAPIRQQLEATGSARIHLDLLPARAMPQVAAALCRPRGSRSLAKQLKDRLGLDGVKAALLREQADPPSLADPLRLAGLIKRLPIQLVATRPLDEAISSAGGVPFEALDARLMLRALPGTFCAGEMLDWEAPTGGYLLTACLASGRAAAQGLLAWLDKTPQPAPRPPPRAAP